MAKYSEKLHLILSRVYRLRSLSYSQIKLYLLPEISENYLGNILRGAVKESYLVKFGRTREESYYQITNKGIKFLKKYGIIELGCSHAVFATFPNSYLTASKIAFSPPYKNHQLALNDFVLRFEHIYGETEFYYYDEKMSSEFVKNIRPDGVLLWNNKVYFLEMDMNTERSGRLLQKWNNYRYFVNSVEFKNFEYDIEVLFILSGKPSELLARKYYIWKQIMGNIGDIITPSFDFIVEKEDRLINEFARDIIGRESAAELLKNTEYNAIEKPSLPPGTYCEKGGKLYICDVFIGLSTLSKIREFTKYRNVFSLKYEVEINYLVILMDDCENKTREILEKIPGSVEFLFVKPHTTKVACFL